MKWRLGVAAVVVALIGGFVFSLYLPWLTQWNSTDAERSAPMAGDSQVAEGRQWTRAITIDAPPERVWPWLVQIGVDKAGFYTFDWAENLFGDPVHNADRIHPEWQGLRPGDPVRPSPRGDPWIAQTVAAPRLLVLTGDHGNWSWSTDLRPMPGGRTRVVTRMRSTGHGQLGFFLDPADLIVFPRLLVGLQQRAEGTLPGLSGTPVGSPLPGSRLPVVWWAALAWLAGLAAFGAAAARTLGFGEFGRRRPHPGILTGVGFVAGAAYMIMSDTPPAQFLSRNWGLGLGVAAALGVAAGQLVRAAEPAGRRFLVGRALQAVTEAGLWLVLPVTAVWQAATRLGWTDPVAGHSATVIVAGVATAAVAGTAWWRAQRQRGVVLAAILAVAYALSGSALAVLAAAVVMEVVAGWTAPSSGQPSDRPDLVNAGSGRPS